MTLAAVTVGEALQFDNAELTMAPTVSFLHRVLFARVLLMLPESPAGPVSVLDNRQLGVFHLLSQFFQGTSDPNDSKR